MPTPQLEVLECAGPTFTANNAVLQVAVALGATTSFQGPTPPTAQWFQPGDNLLLKRWFTRIPHGYLQGTGQHYVDLYFENSAGGLVPIPEVSPGAGSSRMFIPSLCEVAFDDLFIQMPKTGPGNARHRLVLVTSVLNVSQVNAPAVLNGQVINVIYDIMVEHTLEMELAP